MNKPTLTIDLACQSCLEFADLLPFVTGSRSLFTSAVVKQLDKNCGRRFEVSVVPFDISKAKAELEAEAEAHADVMSRSQLVATKVRAILEQADATSDVLEVARLLRELRQVATNPFGWGR
jgi:hypothetical protein